MTLFEHVITFNCMKLEASNHKSRRTKSLCPQTIPRKKEPSTETDICLFQYIDHAIPCPMVPIPLFSVCATPIFPFVIQMRYEIKSLFSPVVLSRHRRQCISNIDEKVHPRCSLWILHIWCVCRVRLYICIYTRISSFFSVENYTKN